MRRFAGRLSRDDFYFVVLMVAVVWIVVPTAIAPTAADVCNAPTSEDHTRLETEKEFAALLVLLGAVVSFGVGIAALGSLGRTSRPHGLVALGILGILGGVVGVALAGFTVMVIC